MTQSATKRAAVLTVGMNILLTTVKFTAFFFTGSLAILAEAWHSFTDVGTSIMVLFAVKDNGKQPACTESGPDEQTAGTPLPEEETEESGPGPMDNFWEIAASVAIGVLLAFVGGMILWKVAENPETEVRNALGAGIFFLVFALGSYFIYRYETRVGRTEGSIGLVCDGMHARADMVGSILTGFSLVLYAAGWNVDRLVATVIALFILSFALETFFNIGLVLVRGRTDRLLHYSTVRIMSLAFSPARFRELANALNTGVKKLFGETRAAHLVYRTLLALPILILVGWYLSTCLFFVGVREKAVVERMGRPVPGMDPVGPGLHAKLPWPFDRVLTVDTETVRAIHVGNVRGKTHAALLWTNVHAEEDPFLSGDNNLFYPALVIPCRIKDPRAFLYGQADSFAVVREAANRIATRVFAKEDFYTIAGGKRPFYEAVIHQALQKEADALGCGVEILDVHFKDVHPPMNVAESFEKVVAAYQLKKRMVNEALAYENRIVPEARGQAEKDLEKARADATDRLDKARGNAHKFLLSRPPDSLSAEVARLRLRLAAAGEAWGKKNLVLVDLQVQNARLWMGFDDRTGGLR